MTTSVGPVDVPELESLEYRKTVLLTAGQLLGLGYPGPVSKAVAAADEFLRTGVVPAP